MARPVTMEALMGMLTDMQADQATAMENQATAMAAATQDLRQEIQAQAVAVQAQAAAIQLLQVVVPPPNPGNAGPGQNPPLQPPAQQQLVGQQQPGQARVLRCLDINGLLKLPPRPSSLQYREWLKTWQLFVVRCRVPTYPMEEQTAALIGTFSSGFDHVYEQIIKRGMNNNGIGATVDDILAAVQDYIQEDNGGLRDRMAFLQRRQQQNEDFAQFWADLQLLGQIKGPCQHCHDSTLVDLVTIGVVDKDLQHELLKERPIPDLQRCLNICQAHVSSVKNAAAIKGSGRTANISNVGRGSGRGGNSQRGRGGGRGRSDRSQSRGRNQSASANANSTTLNTTPCGNCGRTHAQGACPAKGQPCKFCNINGHYAHMCLKKKAQQASGTNTVTTNAPTGLVSVAVKSVDAEPQADVSVTAQHGRHRPVLDVVIDSGAVVNVLPTNFVHKFGKLLKQLDPCSLMLIGFDGTRRRPHGQLQVELQVGDGPRVNANFVVTGGVREPLLCRDTSLELGSLVLPHSRRRTRSFQPMIAAAVEAVSEPQLAPTNLASNLESHLESH